MSAGLSDFLLARIAEDDEMARAADDSEWAPGAGGLFWVAKAGGIICAERSRVLAECEAKRRIVLSLSDSAILEELVEPERPAGYWAQDIGYRALALPYADHPDYREEWKP